MIVEIKKNLIACQRLVRHYNEAKSNYKTKSEISLKEKDEKCDKIKLHRGSHQVQGIEILLSSI